MINIRNEGPADKGNIRPLLERAFGSTEEADIVDTLRTSGSILISLVAQVDEQVVGHVCFSPVTIQGESDTHNMAALGPMAVLPKFQGKGIGSALVRAGLSACRSTDYRAVIVLGHPWFYPKFGFKPASEFGIHWRFDVPDEALMVVELIKGGLDGISGTVKFHPALGG